MIKCLILAKKAILADLNQPQYTDLSPKGSVDEGCLPLMQILNNHEDYVTTSSCSGRISIFHMATKKKKNENQEKEEDNDEQNQNVINNNNNSNPISTGAKRGEPDVATGWVFISHDRVADNDTTIIKSIADFMKTFNIDLKVDEE